VGHSHDDHRGYYLEQLCTIGMCGALGVVAILMWYRGWLSDLLADTFHPAVLLGGISLLVIVAVRAVALWQAAAPEGHHGHSHSHDHAHDHSHEHAHTHAHDHAHEHGPGCDHSHDHDHEHPREHAHHHVHGPDDGHHHGHEHGWVPVRYIVLLLPITLFFLGQPNQEFMRRYVKYLSMHELGGRQGLDPGLLADAPGRIVQGIRIARDDEHDRLQVVSVGKDSDAEKQGLKAGAAITQITQTADADGKPLEKPEVVPTKGLPLEKAVALLKGKPQTKVKLTVEEDGAARDVEITRAEETVSLQFKELERAAYSPATRRYYEGKFGKITGQFVASPNPRVFGLARFKITCCAADAIPLNVMIMLDPQSGETLQGQIPQLQWVEVKGQIQFRKRPDRDEYASVLLVRSLKDDVHPVDPDPTPFIQ
jgi:hypothetical protein